MKQFSLLITSLFFTLLATAQEEGEPVTNPLIKITSNTIYGKVMDKQTSKGLGAVSVQLYGGVAKDSIVGAMFTRANGDFRFTNFSPADSFKLVISAIGYAATEQSIPFSSSGSNGFFEKDLGNILLEQDVKTLTAVTVTAQKPALQMGIDRRIFDVSKSL
ncbi:MAG TPA: carboxypeptidase regulatory-like domain-containing protein, partial [Chitinophagaceae bacterium]|nr:carboxypeptidase regulatory-like domain-containing protein [Chitinophagaceae bacterium]